MPLLIAGRVLAQPAADTAPADPAPPPTSEPAPPPTEAAPLPPSVAPATPLVIRPPSEVPPDRPSRPPLSAGRMAAELGLAALIGGAAGIGAGYLGAGIENANGCSGDVCGLGGFILGGYIGGSIGIGIGVYLAGNAGDQTGSMGAAIGGGFVGGLAGLGLGELVGGMTHNSGLGAVVGFATWPVTSVLFFNLSRHWKPGPVTTGSLLRYDHGRASLGIPLVVRSNDVVGLSLASGSF